MCNEPTFGDLSPEEFEQVLDNVFSDDFGDLTTNQFFEALAAIDATAPSKVIEINCTIDNGQLRLHPAEGIRALGNEIWIGDRKLVLKLEAM